MKKFLSFFLVLCMLLAAVPSLLLPVMAEDAEAGKVFKYSEVYTHFTRVESEKGFKEADPNMSDEDYKAWLSLPDTFKVDQGDYAWKVGEYFMEDGTLAPIARVAFMAADASATQHDMNWNLTEEAYLSKLDDYISSANANGGKGSSSIWGGFAITGRGANFNGLGHTNGAKTAAIVYTVEEEGYYKISFEQVNETWSNGHNICIMVNNEIVWPATATKDNFNSWYKTEKDVTTADAVNPLIAAEAPEVELYAGDKVAFVVNGSGEIVQLQPMLEQVPAPAPVEFSFINEFPAGVTYKIDEHEKNPTGMSDEEYAEWLKGDTFTVDQGDSNWKIGEYVLADNSFVPFTRILFMADYTEGRSPYDMNWVSTEADYLELLEVYLSGAKPSIWTDRPMWHANIGGQYQFDNGMGKAETRPSLSYGRVTTSGSSHVTAIQYTAAEAGTYSVKLNTFAEYGGNGHKLAIIVNNEIVWPAGATTDTNTWYKTAKATTLNEMNAVLAAVNFKVAAGDKVSFCTAGSGDAMVWEPVMVQQPGAAVYVVLQDQGGIMTQSIKCREGATVTLPEYASDLIFFGWDSDGDGTADVADKGTVTVGSENVYLNAITLAPSVFSKNYPNWDADNECVKFYGGWSMGFWDIATKEFSLFQYETGNTFVAGLSGGPWGVGGGAIYYSGHGNAIVINKSFWHGEGDDAATQMVSILKDVDYNGTAVLDFNTLRVDREISSGGTAAAVGVGMAIYVGGEKVWPADEEFHFFMDNDVQDESVAQFAYDAKSEAIANGAWPFPMNLEVGMGEQIEIRMVQGDKNSWMFYVDPTLTYTVLSETPTVSHTSVDVAKDFTLNVYANILSKAEDSVAHLEYWTAKPTAEQLAARGTELDLVAEENGLFKFAYAGLTAKQMADVIYVRPYTTNEAGDICVGNVAEVSIKAYAEKALSTSKDDKLNTLLIAMLNYGAKAQALFGYNVANLANAGLTEAQKNLTADAADLENVYANEDGDNKIKNVSLLMGTDLGMKYMIDSVEGATTYELEVSKNVDFTDSTKIAMTAVWEGKEQKAIHNISFAEMGDTFYVRAIVDGTAGATLTYSAESYILRISESCDDGMYFAAMALAYLGQSIEAYQA